MSRILVDQVRSNSASGDAITLDGSGKCAINATTINSLTFPTSDGSADQIIKTDGSGALSFTTAPSGLNASYARITDTKGGATQGGTFSSGAWRTRDLNTEDEDPDGIVTLSSNQFTLQAGTYYIQAQCCAIQCNNHGARIQNITDSTTTLLGNANKTQQNNVSSYAHIQGSFTISGAKVFELQHRCSTTVTTHGFGAYSGWASNVYSTVEITKRS